MNNRCPMEIYICENMTSFFHLEILVHPAHFSTLSTGFYFCITLCKITRLLILGYILKPEVIEEMFQNNRVIRRLSF